VDFLSAPSNFLVQWFRNFESKDLGPRSPSQWFSRTVVRNSRVCIWIGQISCDGNLVRRSTDVGDRDGRSHGASRVDALQGAAALEAALEAGPLSGSDCSMLKYTAAGDSSPRMWERDL